MICLQRAISRSSSGSLAWPFFVLVVLLFSKVCFAYDLGVTGSLRAAYWNKDKSFNDQRGYSVNSIWLNAKPSEIAGIRTFFDGYIQAQDLSRNTNTTIEPREAYAEYSLGAFDFRVGRQIIVWGKADKINPTDRLSAKNMTLLMVDDENQRLGVFSARAIYNLDQFRLTAVWQPEWRTPVYPIPPLTGITLNQLIPVDSQTQFALKAELTGGDVDTSVSYFNGINRLPDLQFLSASATGINLGLSYNRIQVYGWDAAYNLGGLGMRGEVAYVATSGDNDPIRQNSTIYSVLGADYTFIENFNVNAQVMYIRVLQYASTDSITDPSQKLLADQTALIANQQFENVVGMTLRPSYKLFHETLELETAFVVWFRNLSSIIRPQVSYAISDAFKASIGGELYQGDDNSFFGRLRNVSSVFSELRYYF